MAMAESFLAALDPDADRFTFQLFSDRSDRYAEIIHGTIHDEWPKVEAFNIPERQVGVFVTINATDFRGRSRENIVRPRALFADADGKEQMRRCVEVIEESGARPSLIVRTSANSAHFYWVCDDLAPELAALADKRARGVFKDWRDRLALKSRRQADYSWVVLARVLSVALDRGWIDANPCEKGGRLYHGTRADKIWTPNQVEAFLGSAPPHLLTALMLGLWTGQREGDLLDLTWFAYDGTHIRLVQSKSIRLGNMKRAKRVVIPVGTPLKAMLDAMSRRGDQHILLNSRGRPWTEDGFRKSWAKECKRLGIVGVTFNDLRGTAVTCLALAGCTEPEIHYRPHAQRGPLNLGRSLFAPPSRAWRKRHSQARNANRFSQMPSQTGGWVYRERLKNMWIVNWLGDLDSNQDWRSQSPLSYR